MKKHRLKKGKSPSFDTPSNERTSLVVIPLQPLKFKVFKLDKFPWNIAETRFTFELAKFKLTIFDTEKYFNELMSAI